jgi:hypothetical protein
MKQLKSKQDLIETVLNQIRQDVHCGDYTALEVFLNGVGINNLINYLPEEDWKQFKHLRDGGTT